MAERNDLFTSLDFYKDLSSSISDQIDVQIEGFKRELLVVSLFNPSGISLICSNQLFLIRDVREYVGGKERRQHYRDR